jgi:Group II intron, maturase-specific domain
MISLSRLEWFFFNHQDAKPPRSQGPDYADHRPPPTATDQHPHATVGIIPRSTQADDGVVLCRSAARAEHALAAVGDILAGSGLRLHPDKTKVVDLREGREGLDFLGCHFRARMSGRLWEQRGIVRYYLHRWPSQRAMQRLRAKVRDRTGRNRVGLDIRDVIADLNPILRAGATTFAPATPPLSPARSTGMSRGACSA